MEERNEGQKTEGKGGYLRLGVIKRQDLGRSICHETLTPVNDSS